jgi:hypothetical protein
VSKRCETIQPAAPLFFVPICCRSENYDRCHENIPDTNEIFMMRNGNPSEFNVRHQEIPDRQHFASPAKLTNYL